MRDRRILIGDFTRREFREMLQAGTLKAAIVPTGTTEQHLEHLEMCHDSASVTLVAHRAATALHPAVVVAPTVQVGVSEHHMMHPGTLTTRVGTFLDYDEVYSLVRSKRVPGHANEFETAFALAGFPERVHEEALEDAGASIATREQGERAIEIVVPHVERLLRRMIAGESPTVEPRSFRPGGTVVGAENFPYQSGRTESEEA